MTTARRGRPQKTAQSKKPMKYIERISRPKEEIGKEELALEAEMAKNRHEQATLSLKQQMLGHQSTVKSAQIRVSEAEQKLESARYARPYDPKAVIDAFAGIDKAKDELDAAQKVFDHYERYYNFMVKEAQIFS